MKTSTELQAMVGMAVASKTILPSLPRSTRKAKVLHIFIRATGGKISAKAFKELIEERQLMDATINGIPQQTLTPEYVKFRAIQHCG